MNGLLQQAMMAGQATQPKASGQVPVPKIQRADMPLPLQGYENHPNAAALRDAYNSFGFVGNADGGVERFGGYPFRGVRGPKDVQLIRSAEGALAGVPNPGKEPRAYVPGTYARYAGENDPANQTVFLVPPGTDRDTRMLAGHEFTHRWLDATGGNKILGRQQQEVFSAVVGNAIAEKGGPLSKEEFAELTTLTMTKVQAMDKAELSDLEVKLFKAYPEVEQMLKDRSTGTWNAPAPGNF